MRVTGETDMIKYLLWNEMIARNKNEKIGR